MVNNGTVASLITDLKAFLADDGARAFRSLEEYEMVSDAESLSNLVNEEWMKVMKLEMALSRVVNEFRNTPHIASRLCEPIHGFDAFEEFVACLNRVFVDTVEKMHKTYHDSLIDVLGVKYRSSSSCTTTSPDEDVAIHGRVLLRSTHIKQYFVIQKLQYGVLNVAQTLLDVCEKHIHDLEQRLNHLTRSSTTGNTRRGSTNTSHHHLYS